MNWPNRLTLLRLFIVPFLIITLIYHKDEGSLFNSLPVVLFLLAVITDAVDGYIARHYNQKTDIGTFLDPFADKTLILSTLLCLYFSPTYSLKIPAWALILIGSRDFIIVTWLVTAYVTHTELHIAPNFLGKTTTVFQMAMIFSLLLQVPYAAYLWNATAFLTVCSAISYSWRETRKLQHTPTPQ
jgi:CDP-diacylglycerol--glycerol-3-phosphate 3-phosphatidyltransferase